MLSNRSFEVTLEPTNETPSEARMAKKNAMRYTRNDEALVAMYSRRTLARSGLQVLAGDVVDAHGLLGQWLCASTAVGVQCLGGVWEEP